MIYTIKCRRGHCGSQYSTDKGGDNCGREAKARGWTFDAQGASGWLCPFDAPKEAAAESFPGTRCGFPGCLNMTLAVAPESLVSNGWVGLNNDANEWYCPGCKKMLQPELAQDPMTIETGRLEKELHDFEAIRAVVQVVLKEILERALTNRTMDNKGLGVCVPDCLTSIIAAIDPPAPAPSKDEEMPF